MEKAPKMEEPKKEKKHNKENKDKEKKKGKEKKHREEEQPKEEVFVGDKKPRMDKLFDATNLLHEKNESVFDVAEYVNHECSKFPEFIGVFPFGSQTKGYSTEGSDIDMYVLQNGFSNEIYDVIEKLKKKYDEKGIEMHFISYNYDKRDLSDIGNDLRGLPPSFLLMWRQGKGPAIESCRSEIRREINRLPENRREARIQEIVRALTLGDKASFSKMEERMAKFDQEEWNQQRHDLWENRIRNLLSKE